MNLITKPSVYLVGTQELQLEHVQKFLNDHGVEWPKFDEDMPAEMLTEMGGRLCYMSFGKGRGDNREYLEHILESGHGSVLEHAVWNFVFTGISRTLTHELVRHRAGFGYSQLSQRYVDESVAEYVIPRQLQVAVECYRLLVASRSATSVEDSIKLQEMYPLASKLTGEADKYIRLCEMGSTWVKSVEYSHQSYIKLVEELTEEVREEFYQRYVNTKKAIKEEMYILKKEEWLKDLGAAQKTEIRKECRQAARSVLPNATETKIFVTVNGRAARHFIEMRANRFAEPEIRSLAIRMLQILQIEAPNIFGDYEVVPLPDGTFEAQTKWRKV